MRKSGREITDTNVINGFIDKVNIISIASVLFLSYVVLLSLTGCADHELHRFVAERKVDEVEEDSLGEIVTEGEFFEVNPDNMLCYKGAYKGLDYVTLVFDSSSPIDLENIELGISEHKYRHGYLDGILYQEKDGNKYITFKYETEFFEYPDGTVEQLDATKTAISFNLPTKAGEPMSFYLIRIKPIINTDYDACVSEYIQKEIVEQGNWTDYRYDVRTQYYDKETDSWREENIEDLMTDNMPLE